jgi:cation/acetate symporter
VNPVYCLTVVGAVAVATVAVGLWGQRLSRTTSDFFVASRTVSPWRNASAIGGEYLSAASFLGVAGLILAFGEQMLWLAIGYTAGYLVLLTLVAAPLRRSGAYTLPDFAEARLNSLPVRRITAVLTVGIGWLYLLPQLQGAGLTLHAIGGVPQWLGAAVVATVVTVNVMVGGMRSITLVQALQFWFKLAAIAVPVVFLLVAWHAHGAPIPPAGGPPMADGMGSHPIYVVYSLIVATFLGVMGLPHVIVRFYTSPDGRGTRRTTVMVLVLLGAFYLLPPVYGALGRLFTPDVLHAGRFDTVVLTLPGRLVGGLGGDLLTALLAGGAAGLVVGGGLALLAGLLTLLGVAREGWWRDLLTWPAAWAAPIGFAVMIGVSLATPNRVVPGVSRIMVRLHMPESLGSGTVQPPEVLHGTAR